MNTRRFVGKRLNEGLSIDPVDLATLCHECDTLRNALESVCYYDYEGGLCGVRAEYGSKELDDVRKALEELK